jgi:hypothetical protein
VVPLREATGINRGFVRSRGWMLLLGRTRFHLCHPFAEYLTWRLLRTRISGIKNRDEAPVYVYVHMHFICIYANRQPLICRLQRNPKSTGRLLVAVYVRFVVLELTRGSLHSNLVSARDNFRDTSRGAAKLVRLCSFV